MTIKFDSYGFKAEHLCVAQFNGELITDLQQQYKDIDCLVRTKKGTKYTASVKDQVRSTKQGYNTIQLELEQVNTGNMKSTVGCFYKNESDFYFWLVHHSNAIYWCIVKSKALKDFVAKNKEDLKTWQTTHKTEAMNKSYGRYYDRSKGVLVTIEQLKNLGELKLAKVELVKGG